jgi:hypothetical protein
MGHRDGFWKLEHLSDAQLLQSLATVVHTQRRTLAQLVAHLGEVEDRRLHLEAAYNSMFAYCVGRLGMSEDEACRRIELARLARKFPALFVELERGQITLSVALVLKPILTPDNHRELLCAARGKSAQQARELLAERLPKPDVPSSIRKLPERRPAAASELALSSLPAALPSAPELAAAALSPPMSAPASMSLPEPTDSSKRLEAAGLSAAVEGARPLPASRPGSVPAWRSIEPLSAQRYRIQFTADAELKRKLELARDLLRHAHPTGDFAPVVSRALDLLLDDLQRRRFGAGARRKCADRSANAGGTPSGPDASGHSDLSPSPSPNPSPPPWAAAAVVAAHLDIPPSPNAAPPPSAAAASCNPSSTLNTRAKVRRSYVPRAARRAVLERDGLGCSWVDARGVRCGSRAWLELDHRQPSGKGGSSEPDNVRMLCRAHNQLAAEHAYGREHIERAARRGQAARRERERGTHRPGERIPATPSAGLR